MKYTFLCQRRPSVSELPTGTKASAGARTAGCGGQHRHPTPPPPRPLTQGGPPLSRPGREAAVTAGGAVYRPRPARLAAAVPAGSCSLSEGRPAALPRACAPRGTGGGWAGMRLSERLAADAG